MQPQQIGRYKIQGTQGQGGMSTVYRGYDPRFQRLVAIKVLPPQFLHEPKFRARFEREARTVANLEHASIVPVYDYGEDAGLLYLVMRLMRGGSLATRLESAPLPLAETARIFRRLAPALDFAHQQGIIHRDLKPGNILFDEQDAPFLSDFGIVKLAEGSGSTLTAAGGLMGTPAYMSPEQVRTPKDLDGRSDIYAMGVILFEMLSGRRPFENDTPFALAMMHVLDPVPDILTRNANLPSGSRTIVGKALAKDRDQRYQTAVALAGDIDRLAQQATGRQAAVQPIPTRPDKHGPLPPASARPASSTTPETGRPTSSESLPERETVLESPPDGPPSSKPAQPTDRPPTPGTARPSPAGAMPHAARTWLPLAGMATIAAVIGVAVIVFGFVYLFRGEPLPAGPFEVAATAFNTSGKQWSAAAKEETIYLWPTGGRQRTTILAGHTSRVLSLAFSSGSRQLASGSDDGTIRLWQVDDGQELLSLSGHESGVTAVAFSIDGRALASGSWDMNVRQWDLNDGLPQRRLSGPEDAVTALAFSPGGRLLAAGMRDGQIRIWQAENGISEFVLSGHIDRVQCLAFSPDARYLASGSWDKTIRLWNLETGENIGVLDAGSSAVWTIDFTQDSQLLASGGWDGRVKLWGVPSGTFQRTVAEQLGRVMALAFASDDQSLVTLNADGQTGSWPLVSDP